MPKAGAHVQLAPAAATATQGDLAASPTLGPSVWTGQGWFPLAQASDSGSYDWTDFILSPSTSTAPPPWLLTVSSGALSYSALATDPPGVAKLTTGTVAAGRAAISNDAVARLSVASSVEWWFWGRIRLSALSSGTQTYSASAGFMDGITALPIRGAAISHQNGLANWQLRTGQSAGVNVDTGVPVVAGQWVNFAIKHTLSAATIWISTGANDLPTTPTATQTTAASLPTAATLQMAAAQVTSTVGTTAKVLDLDYLGVAALFPSGRAV